MGTWGSASSYSASSLARSFPVKEEKPTWSQPLISCYLGVQETLPLCPERYRNSYSLQRGMKFSGLHSHQNQSEIRGWGHWSGSAIEEELSYRVRTCTVDLCGSGICGRNPPFGQTRIFPCGNSFNSGPLLPRPESRVQHQEFKLAPVYKLL